MAPVSAGDAVRPAPASLKAVSYENRSLRIRLDRPVPYKVFSLSKPTRLVVELSETLHADRPYEARVDDDVLRKIRSAQFKNSPDKVTRVVLDMPRMVPYQATQEGESIILNFEARPETAKGVPRPAGKRHPEVSPGYKPGSFPDAVESVEGSAEEQTLSTAVGLSSSGARVKHTAKDLLATLPKNPVTIDFDDAEVRDVLRVLSEMSGINIIYAANIRGFVTVHLDQVPFNEAFSTILTMQGLVGQQMGSNVLRILTPEDLNSDRARAVVTYKTFTLNYAKATEVQPHLSLVRISPNARVTVDDRSNSIIVTDTPEGIAAAERLIGELDTKPQQVLIETKMVEVALTDEMDLGIRWEYANVNQGTGGTQIIGLRDSQVGTNLDPGTAGFVQGANVVRALTPNDRGTGVGLPSRSPDAAAITFGFINNTDILTATLNALSTKRKTKILASPRVITLNNQMARIQVGSRLPFSTISVSPGGVTTQNISFQEVGIILTVTPIINADSRVRLRVRPEVSLPGAPTAAGPQIQTRNAETEVIIRDGETLVVGGLIDEQTRSEANKVPLLGDIPVLGVFFRNNFDQKVRTELLVFVTPRIVQE